MKKVLIVEDELSIREAVIEALELEGFEALGAAHGQAAWAQLQAGYLPDVILVDLMMPVMGGAELIQKLKSTYPWQAIPVILFSASSQTASAMLANEVLPKPIHLDGLFSAVRRQCGLPDSDV